MYGTIPQGRVILLLGEPGSGNQLFALQSLYHQAKNGRYVIFFTLDYPKEDIITEMNEYGWQYEEVKDRWKFIEQQPEENVEKKTQEFIESIKRKYWCGIDTINTVIREMKISEVIRTVERLRRTVRENMATSYIIMMEREQEERVERGIKRIVDGIITFKRIEGNIGRMQVEKMMGKNIQWYTLIYRIMEEGIRVETTTTIR